jgi:hypothetical protein
VAVDGPPPCATICRLLGFLTMKLTVASANIDNSDAMGIRAREDEEWEVKRVANPLPS